MLFINWSILDPLLLLNYIAFSMTLNEVPLGSNKLWLNCIRGTYDTAYVIFPFIVSP